MLQELVSPYRRWFAYEKDAHAQVVRSLETVPLEKRDTAEYRKAITLLAHLAAARRMWLCRLGESDAMPVSFFPTDVDLPTAAAQLRAVQEE